MKYEEYCHMMKKHGICELYFLYNDAEYAIFRIYDWSPRYFLCSAKKTLCDVGDFDLLVQSPLFGGKRLAEVWDDIEILEIDGGPEEEFYLEEDFDYAEWERERGEIQWEHQMGLGETRLLQLKYALPVFVVFLLLSALFPLLHLSNWNMMLLSGGVVLFTLAVVVIWQFMNKETYGYCVTDKKIFAQKGLLRTTTYDNIKSVKLRRSLFRKGYGTVWLRLKKGLALDYAIECVPDAEKVYHLILENLRISREQDTNRNSSNNQ